MAFVEMKDVYKRYRTGEIVTAASDGINFTIEKGEFAIIVGPSGAGKTTVLNILGDALQPFLLCGPYFSGMPPVEVGQSWLVGAAWVAATSAVGIALFRRREIR